MPSVLLSGCASKAEWASHGQPPLRREICYLAVLTHLTVSTQWPSRVMVTEAVDFQTINSLVLYRRCYLNPALMSMESVRLTRWFYSFPNIMKQFLMLNSADLKNHWLLWVLTFHASILVSGDWVLLRDPGWLCMCGLLLQ